MMHDTPSIHSSARPRMMATQVAVLMGLAAISAGCSSTPETRAAGRPVRPADFALDGPGGAPLAIVPPPASSPTPQPHAPARIGPIAASEGLLDIQAAAGSPPQSSLPADGGSPRDPTPIGAPVFVDGKLGDINGSAVFASVFLDRGSLTVEPLGPQLQQQARQLTPEQWRATARRQITQRVRAFVQDELLRAEALASLSPDEKQGFFAFLDRLQRDFQRQQGGSRAVAERRLQETQGITLDELRRKREDQELVRFQLTERVANRVQVGARDIEQRYAQMFDTFNPPPLATFRQIIIPASRAQAREEFERRLAAGESFEELAKGEWNIAKREQAGLEERDFPPQTPGPDGGPPRPRELFANPRLNDAANRLRVGDVAGPIEVSGGVAWLKLESVRERAQSLYDAQLRVEDLVRSERFQREERRYIARLASEASLTDVDAMVERLVALAELRYLPAGSGRPSRSDGAGGR